MKKTKRLCAFLLMLVMVVQIAPAASAAPPDEYGSITIHKFDNTGADAGADHDGQEINLDPSTGGLDLGEPIEGVKFRVSQVVDNVNGNPIDASTLTAAQAAAFVRDNEANSRYSSTPSATGLYQEELTTNSDGEAEFPSSGGQDLQLGIYLVEELGGVPTTATVAPFLVHIPLTIQTDPTTPGVADTLVYDVHVYPKNERLYITKEGDVTKANVGVDTVTWTIEAGIPSDIGQVDPTTSPATGYYIIQDVLDSRLSYQSTSVKLTGGGVGISDVTLSVGTHYALDATDLANNIVSIDFNTTTGINALAQGQQDGQHVEVEIVTTIDRSAAVDLTQNIENTVTLYYNVNGDPDDKDTDDDNKVTPVDPTPPAVVPTGLAVYKVDPYYSQDASGDYVAAPLAGAEFDLYYSDDGINAYTKIDTGTTDNFGLIYWMLDDAQFQSGTSGYIGYGYYYVQETKAPAGYSMQNAISTAYYFDLANATTGEGYTWTVYNYKLNGGDGDDSGFTLPATGGSGTLFYTAAGVSLIGAAVLVLALSRRKKKS